MNNIVGKLPADFYMTDVENHQAYAWAQSQNNIYNNVQTLGVTPNASMTPYIIEERQMNMTQMDIYSRMMMERILFVSGPVNDQMSTTLSAQLLFLQSIDPEKDITLYIDTPGGSVKSGLTIVDTINFIKPDVRTICTGMAASMGSVLLGCGTKGKRQILPSARVMLHQVSGGAQGHVKDMNITVAEANKYNEKLFKMLASYCDKDYKEMVEMCERDVWLNAEEALAYGIVDKIS